MTEASRRYCRTTWLNSIIYETLCPNATNDQSLPAHEENLASFRRKALSTFSLIW